MKLRFVQVDAFADAPFTGNPAAVMPLDAWLPDATLQAIAAENNLSETAFLVADKSGVADYELRWFTPTIEVALCGHATLASGHVLLANDSGRCAVTFRTRKSGLLRVERADDGYRLDLPAWEPTAKALPELVVTIDPAPDETLWRDGGYALFVYPDAVTVRALEPNLAALAKAGDVMVIATAPGDDSDILSRVFAPGAGVAEDPVTGSAHSILAPYWAKRLGRDSFSAIQASPRGGQLGCALVGDRVILSARCVTVIEGRFILPD